jgi:hypothetical protein
VVPTSRQAIKKYIKANNKLGDVSDAQFNSLVNRALANGEKNGEFLRPKGASGPVKIAKKEAKKETKPAAKKEAKPATKVKGIVCSPRCRQLTNLIEGRGSQEHNKEDCYYQGCT